MEYTKEQIIAAVDATSPSRFIQHVLNEEYSEAVFVAMKLSSDQDGNLTQEDKDLIATL